MNRAQSAVAGILQLLGLLGCITTMWLLIAILSGGVDLSVWFAVGLGALSVLLLAGRYGPAATPNAVPDEKDPR